MKKRIYILLLTALLLCVLCSCACEHQWQAADCTAPQTCSACGETQGELGEHSWTDASCISPKTCSVCGETQGALADHIWTEASCAAPKTCSVCGLEEGEALSHNYQAVSFTSDSMKLQCQLCKDSRSEPIDRELYLQFRLKQLAGYWDLFAIESGASQLSARHISGIGPYLVITEDCALQLHLENGDVLDLACQLVSHQDHTYTCNLVNNETQVSYPAVFTDTSSEPEMSITLPDGRRIILRKNALLEEFIVGTWVNFTDHDQLCTLEMNPDRTFTTNLLDVTGTWHIKPMYIANRGMDLDCFDLALSYTVNGQPAVYKSQVDIALAGNAAAVLNGSEHSMATFLWQDGPSFQYFLWAPDVYTGEHTVVQEDAAKIVGSWVSTEVTTYIYELFTSTTEKTSDYSVVFNEDGTFEMTTQATVAGEWTYICTTNDNGRLSYHFNLKFEGKITHTAITIYDNGASMEWNYYESLSGLNGMDYRFQKAD